LTIVCSALCIDRWVTLKRTLWISRVRQPKDDTFPRKSCSVLAFNLLPRQGITGTRAKESEETEWPVEM